MTLLDMRQVRYTYAGTSRPVLEGIDLEVDAGEVVGVVGPNDAGKSTLCLVAAGLAPGVIGGRLDGTVELGGASTAGLRPHEAAQRAGILFQNPLTQLSGTTTTVFEEVAFGPRNLGASMTDVLATVEWALATLGIDHLAPRDPQRLSGGQAQLVALASVLALRPALLVLDEPTSQLDPSGTRLVGDALAVLATEAGTSILVVEHAASLLSRLARRVLVMEDGRIVDEGPPDAVFSSPSLLDRGVEPPGAVTVARAAQDAGVDHLLAGLDLRTLEAQPVVRAPVARDHGTSA